LGSTNLGTAHVFSQDKTSTIQTFLCTLSFHVKALGSSSSPLSVGFLLPSKGAVNLLGTVDYIITRYLPLFSDLTNL
jgi:hypothetical protein